MTTILVDPLAHIDRRPRVSDEVVARRSRVASGAMVLVLFAVSAFALWSSEATSAAASRAVAASGLSDAYVQAASAISTEEMLEYEYHLTPGAEVRASFAEAAATLVAALAHVREDGSAGDRVLVDRVLADHRAYVAAIDLLFAAVDQGDTAAVLRVDTNQTEPAFAAIHNAVSAAAVA